MLNACPALAAPGARDRVGTCPSSRRRRGGDPEPPDRLEHDPRQHDHARRSRRRRRNAASTADTLRLSHLTSYSLTWTRAPTAHRSLGRLTVRATHGDDRTGGYTAYPTHARRRAHQVSTRKSHRWRGKPPMAKLPPGLPELVSDGGGDDGATATTRRRSTAATTTSSTATATATATAGPGWARP